MTKFNDETASLQQLDIDSSHINVYPNPFDNEITVALLDTEGPYTIKIFDVQGKLIYIFENANGMTTINVQAIPNGMYFMEIKSFTGEQRVFKIIINVQPSHRTKRAAMEKFMVPLFVLVFMFQGIPSNQRKIIQYNRSFKL